MYYINDAFALEEDHLAPKADGFTYELEIDGLNPRIYFYHGSGQAYQQ